MKLQLTGWLLIWAVLATLVAAVCGYRWATASTRCDTRIAEARLAAETDAAEHFQKALRIATGIFEGAREQTRGELDEAAGNTHTRETVIREVRVTGACVMPKGLPDLTPAVQEARDAARD